MTIERATPCLLEVPEQDRDHAEASAGALAMAKSGRGAGADSGRGGKAASGGARDGGRSASGRDGGRSASGRGGGRSRGRDARDDDEEEDDPEDEPPRRRSSNKSARQGSSRRDRVAQEDEPPARGRGGSSRAQASRGGGSRRRGRDQDYDDDDEDDRRSRRAPPSQKPLVMGLAIGGGVLLLVIIVLIIVLTSTNLEDQKLRAASLAAKVRDEIAGQYYEDVTSYLDSVSPEQMNKIFQAKWQESAEKWEKTFTAVNPAGKEDSNYNRERNKAKPEWSKIAQRGVGFVIREKVKEHHNAWEAKLRELCKPENYPEFAADAKTYGVIVDGASVTKKGAVKVPEDETEITIEELIPVPGIASSADYNILWYDSDAESGAQDLIQDGLYYKWTNFEGKVENFVRVSTTTSKGQKLSVVLKVE